MASTDELDRLLSIDDVSEMLQIPVQSIYKQRAVGRFCPAYRIGRHLRWRRGELLNWLETRKDPV
ncbi:helix-turn-helix transcriptional regulator [Pseudonocardia sp. GCM10023141]|uniref:helix-turn-helix transcriptional regulator n=1 Tax=Pseudonocardia sp. GCM10023141 TaxID=3252653 RepID=UPI003611B7C9